MCGRFTQFDMPANVARQFRIEAQHGFVSDWSPRYNLAPSQQAMIVRNDAEGLRQLETMTWGFVPGWAKDLHGMPRPINAKAETVAEKPMFRGAFKRTRCLIPCTGFYEWHTTEGGKQPFFIGMQDDTSFALAGLWERWEREDQSITSFTILVTEANALMQRIHDRMPVILAKDNWEAWLNASTPIPQVTGLMKPYGSKLMAMRPVSKRVNNARNEGVELIEREGHAS